MLLSLRSVVQLPPSTVKPSLDAVYDTTLAERRPAFIGQAGKNNSILATSCFRTL